MTLDELKIIKEEEAGKKPVKELIDIWHANHRIVLEYFMSAKLPYFGLHGAPKASVEGILKERKARLEMGTFYYKEKSEFRIYQFYALCSYVSNYCKEPNNSHETEGGIFVFDLEGEHGENITFRWEHLLSSGLEFIASDYDTEEEKKMLWNFDFLNPENNNNNLWRTEDVFYDDKFETRFKGVVTRSDLKRVEKDVTGRRIALYRLDAQYNLAKVFDRISQE